MTAQAKTSWTRPAVFGCKTSWSAKSPRCSLRARPSTAGRRRRS
jgi:hypothetical protein